MSNDIVSQRFVSDGDTVRDTDTGAVARFGSTESAREAADWMNSGDATISDYVWNTTGGAA